MNADSDEADILVLSRADAGSAKALAAIAQTPGLALRSAERPEAAEAMLSESRNGSPVHLIVIGPDIERPLLLARQLRRMSPFSQILFLREKDRLKRLSETLSFVPDLSGAWAVDAEAGAEQIGPIVAEAVEVSRARRRAAALPDRLNLMLERSEARNQTEPRRQSPVLWQSFFSAVLSQAPDPVFATDVEGNLLTWNDAAVAFFGAKPEETGDSAPTRLPEPWLKAVSGLLGRAASGQQVAQHEARLPRADGAHVDLSLSLAPVRDENDRVVCISFVARDVSQQKELQNQQQLLIRELNHRVKNVLALVQSIARRTAQHTGDVEDFLQAFDGRLQAMSAAHALLSESWWRGAALPDIARAVLDLHFLDGRIELELPGVQLSPALASSLALVLNELGTNAAKHGALSAAKGRIRLSGRIGANPAGDPERQLELEWREEGGPAITTPDRSGFGTRLITQLVAYQHQGHVDMDWAKGGLVCRMAMPLVQPRTA